MSERALVLKFPAACLHVVPRTGTVMQIKHPRDEVSGEYMVVYVGLSQGAAELRLEPVTPASPQ